MHEMSIAVAVVDQVSRAAAEHGARSVTAVRLDVGELAGVVPAALDFCWDLACEGTALAGAVLSARTVTARARCVPCAVEWAPGLPPDLGCPGCGGGRVELLTGRELQIRGVDWADAPGPGPGPTEEA
ncbi:hydrogenase maturation nickel metallochaperone HypA/HybF [Streptomyces tsukubensis]|uniref:hydrogenase maturation nickel metallochaperone HypA/HybF n=1 Tax=Streptomyces tsukubensis TaxID=83656 RepID=UPI00368323D3